MITNFWNSIVAWVTDKGPSIGFNIIVAILIFVVGFFAIRLIVSSVGKVVEKGAMKKTLLGNFIRAITSKACWAILIVIVLERLGVNIGPIIAGLGITGFILGFAFQESLGNLASGLMIAINQPFSIGDYVIIAGLEGTVRKVDMMATELATADNKKVVIPNKSAWGAPIINFSALGKRRVDIQIGIDYSSDISKAIRIVLELLPSIPGVLATPSPLVTVAKFNESSITLNIRPWTEGANYWNVYNDVQIAVKNAFEENNIRIPFPQLTVHVDK